LELQPVDVIALTGEAVDQARIMAGEREVSLHTDGRGRLLVPADRDRLKQVLLVLLDNALKYGRQTPEGWVRVQVWREDGTALVSVADNGPGIAPQDLPHIFDRFYRAERGTPRRTPDSDPAAAAQHRPTGTGDTPRPSEQRDGTGLGLAIARAIVRAHGGMLNVRSEPGVGATFTVSLPLAPAPALGAGPRETRI